MDIRNFFGGGGKPKAKAKDTAAAAPVSTSLPAVSKTPKQVRLHRATY